jgi:hypothetical protein
MTLKFTPIRRNPSCLLQSSARDQQTKITWNAGVKRDSTTISRSTVLIQSGIGRKILVFDHVRYISDTAILPRKVWVINAWIHSDGQYDLVTMADPLVDLFINGIGNKEKNNHGTGNR